MVLDLEAHALKAEFGELVEFGGIVEGLHHVVTEILRILEDQTKGCQGFELVETHREFRGKAIFVEHEVREWPGEQEAESYRLQCGECGVDAEHSTALADCEARLAEDTMKKFSFF